MRRPSGLEDGGHAVVTEKGHHDEGKIVKLLYWDHRRRAWWTICYACGRHGDGNFLTFYSEENLCIK